jgi:hypothetical protein
MSVQLGAVCYNFIYVDSDKPYYHKGNTKLMAINLASICVFLLAKVYYVFRNKQKDREWEKLTEVERIEYIRHSPDKGCKRLDFRFAH